MQVAAPVPPRQQVFVRNRESFTLDSTPVPASTSINVCDSRKSRRQEKSTTEAQIVTWAHAIGPNPAPLLDGPPERNAGSFVLTSTGLIIRPHSPFPLWRYLQERPGFFAAANPQELSARDLDAEKVKHSVAAQAG